MLYIQDGKMQLVDHNLVVVVDILLLLCTEVCELAFSGCLVLWSWESLNLPLLFSGNLFDADRSRKWLSGSSARKMGLSRPVLILALPRLLKFSIHLSIVGCAGGVFWYLF